MKVETLPLNVYFPKVAAAKNEFSLILMGWDNTSTNRARDFLTTILHSCDIAKRLGQGNRAYYSDATYDCMVEDEVIEPDATHREVKIRAAVRYITETFEAVPLHVQYTILASRRDLVTTPRIDEQTPAMEVRPAR
jgi:peptide/nickel transport system substrate-binding protein